MQVVGKEWAEMGRPVVGELRTAPLAAKFLVVGMLVDLESCPYLKNTPYAQYMYGQVCEVERETSDCVAVGYEGIDVIGYPVDAKLQVLLADAEPTPAATA